MSSNRIITIVISFSYGKPLEKVMGNHWYRYLLVSTLLTTVGFSQVLQVPINFILWVPTHIIACFPFTRSLKITTNTIKLISKRNHCHSTTSFLHCKLRETGPGVESVGILEFNEYSFSFQGWFKSLSAPYRLNHSQNGVCRRLRDEGQNLGAAYTGEGNRQHHYG